MRLTTGYSRLTMLTLMVCLPWLGWAVSRAQTGRSAAVRSMARAEWRSAREQLGRYLRLHPGDLAARMMLAEAFGLDESLDGQEGARLAIEQLRRVPDDAPQAALARTKEGSLRLLLLNQPVAGEKLLKRAIEIDPGNFEAHYMLWKLLSLTGRSHLTWPVFWKTYELSPADRQLDLLCEWYLSEFHLGFANAPLDRKMGFLEDDETQWVLVEFKRLYRFWIAEPDAATAGCAVARLYLRDGMRREAREVLDEIPSLARSDDDPYYVATKLAIHLDFGEFDAARSCMDGWPLPLNGHEFWRWKGAILEEVDRDDRRAVEAYEQAIAIWPGDTSWQLMHREAHCLDRLSLHQEARELRARALAVQSQMEPGFHARLRQSLKGLEEPADFQMMIDFYTRIKRQREAEAWELKKRNVSRIPDRHPADSDSLR